jgi:hypothetical protein
LGRLGLLAGIAIIVFIVIAPFAYFSVANPPAQAKADPFYFGVTYGLESTDGAKQLIDKVQNYTNLFVLDSFPISQNQTALNEVCSYAANHNLHFIVYFFSLYSFQWQQDWVVLANQTWPGNFLGVYLRDEPGGRQIEQQEVVSNASTYSEASQMYVAGLLSTWSMSYLKQHQVPVFTSDFALYWFDYQGGFDCVFAQIGWNASSAQHIGLCRGAAALQGKEWGALISWTYQQPPYFAGGAALYRDMVVSYDAGAKYVVVFNYPQYPQDNPYGVLDEEYFGAMAQFWLYAQSTPRDPAQTDADAVLVLPQDYGWGMRGLYDSIWGLWPPDKDCESIWQTLFQLIDQHGLRLDIVYAGTGTNLAKQYAQVYYWNQTSL